MSNYFIFTPDSGSVIDSSSYNVLLSGLGTYGAPERDVTAVSIPGRNGDLIFDNGRFFNAEVFYDCGMSRNFVDFDTFRSLLMLNSTTYGWLTDTYHPSEKRRARVARIEEISTTAANLGGKFRVVFDCKPQRYLASGDTPASMTSGTPVSVTLATPYPAYPLIEITFAAAEYVKGTAVLDTGSGRTVEVPFTKYAGSASAVLAIDCELRRATLSGYPVPITRLTDEFPYLVPGTTNTMVVALSYTTYPQTTPTITYRTREYVI